MQDKLHPREKLGIARTVLANERTLLAIIRTALGSFIGGASLFKFFGHAIKKLISDIDPEDWQALEALVQKEKKSKE